MAGTRGPADGLSDPPSGPDCRGGMVPAGMGGHALRRKDVGGWCVELSAGKRLVPPATVVSTGLTPAGTEIPTAGVTGAEGGAGADLIGQLNSLESTVLVGRSAADGQGHGAALGTGQTDRDQDRHAIGGRSVPPPLDRRPGSGQGGRLGVLARPSGIARHQPPDRPAPARSAAGCRPRVQAQVFDRPPVVGIGDVQRTIRAFQD